MKFTLILCTLGRDVEVEAFLKSLSNQTYQNFELIIVDQNIDERVNNIVQKFNFRDLRYFKVKFTGLSKARNFALNFTTGDVVCFPDDDCVYSTNVLQAVAANLQANDVCMAGFSYEVARNRFVSSYRVFFSSNVIDGFWFDESLGVGSGTVFGAAEELDLIHRVCYASQICSVNFDPSIEIVHPPGSPENFPSYKVISYARGNGAFYVKNFGLFKAMYFGLGELIKSFKVMNAKKTLSALYKIIGAIEYKRFRSYYL